MQFIISIILLYVHDVSFDVYYQAKFVKISKTIICHHYMEIMVLDDIKI